MMIISIVMNITPIITMRIRMLLIMTMITIMKLTIMKIVMTI